jgi:hypothetical protein
MRRLLVSLCLVFGLAACGSSSQAESPPATAGAPAPASTAIATPATTSHPVVHHPRPRRRARSDRAQRRRVKSSRARPANGLAYSTASAYRVQPQPAVGTCHAAGHGLYLSPDPHCTPGALNPAVTQATIAHTICVSGYTKTIRPSESVTEREKLASMAAYGDGGRSPHDFEYDHLVSLELGGAVNDARNLWPEPGSSPNPKDSVEDHLRRLVCDRQMPLAEAQHIIATAWLRYASAHGEGAGSTPARTPAPTSTSPVSPPSSGGGPNKPISEINCSDFSTHADAQQWFTAHGGSSSNDVAGLDGDHDGIACESLP